MAIKILAGIAKDGTNEGARVSAAVALLDRGWGKAPQAHTGENGEGDLRVTIRHIVEAVGANGQVVDVTPLPALGPPDDEASRVIEQPPRQIDVAKNGDGS